MSDWCRTSASLTSDPVDGPVYSRLSCLFMLVPPCQFLTTTCKAPLFSDYYIGVDIWLFYPGICRLVCLGPDVMKKYLKPTLYKNMLYLKQN